MTLTVEATYENGFLRLAAPLPLEEQQRVRVIVQPEPTGNKAVSLRHEPSTIEPDVDRAASEDEPAGWEMVDIVLNVPPSPDAISVVAHRAEIWPSPYKIDASDLAPE